MDKNKTVKILIGGDVCPIGRNLPYFIDGDAKSIFNDLLPEFEKADLSIVNLECPLIEESSPIEKNGPVLGAESGCINALKQAGIDVLNLANNHIMDHGPKGLANTLQVCADSQIMTVGAGSSLENANKMCIQKIGDIRIGIMAVAEHEFSIAKKAYWGANPLDLVSMIRTAATHRKDFDYLIILIHGGNEHYPLPSPRLMNVCRFLVEMGADAVIVQHTHCPGCFEEYRGAFIVYGQGNLVFDELRPSYSSWNKGFLVRLSIEDIGKHSLTVIPYEQSDGQIGAWRMLQKTEESFMIDIDERSSKLSDTGYIEEQWLTWCRNRKYDYYFRFFPRLLNNRIAQKINSYFPFIERLYTRKHLLRLENMIRCESHREVIETLLEKRREGNPNLIR